MSWEDIRRIYFKDETDESYIKGIAIDTSAIRLIENPSERVCLAVVEQNSFAIIHIKTPTFNVYKRAIERNRNIVSYITIPDEVLAYFLDEHPEFIKIMKNPSIQDNLMVLKIYSSDTFKYKELKEYFYELMMKLSEKDSLSFIQIMPELFCQIKQPTLGQIYTYLKLKPGCLCLIDFPKRAEEIPPAEIPTDDSEI